MSMRQEHESWSIRSPTLRSANASVLGVMGLKERGEAAICRSKHSVSTCPSQTSHRITQNHMSSAKQAMQGETCRTS